jgi:Methyltransferase domain
MTQTLRERAVGAGLDRNRLLRNGYRASASAWYFARGYRYARRLAPPAPTALANPRAAGELEEYFDTHNEGPGMLKWRHYFEIYERHLARFRGRQVNVVEIGVLGGGSLEMWRRYLGEQSHIIGIDIDEESRRFQKPGVDIVIGNQEDPAFWSSFLSSSPAIDIVIDDGGHQPEQQAVTLECLLPHIRAGGVYLCEDIHGPFQPFHSMIDGLARSLSDIMITDVERPRVPASALHLHVESVHRYPLLTVIEKRASRVEDYTLVSCGSEWPASFTGAHS